MATSTCIKCGSTSFELKQARNVANTNYVYCFVQCSNCGGVVGVLENYNINDTLKKLAEQLNVTIRF